MSPAKNTFILGSLSLVLFFISLFQILSLFPSVEVRPNFCHDLMVVMIMGLNGAIIFGWLGFGFIGGLSLSIASALLFIPLAVKLGMSSSLDFALTLVIIYLIGYSQAKKKDEIEQGYRLRMEKLQEENNILSNDIDTKQREAEALRKKFKRYAILKNVAEELSTTLSLDEIMKIVVEESLSVIGKSERCQLFLVDSEKQDLALAASKVSSGTERIKSKKGDAFDRFVFKERRSLIIEEIGKDFRFSQEYQEQGKDSFRSLISSPLISQHKVIGVVRHDVMRSYHYTQEDLRLLDFIADLAAVAIENCFLYRRTEELAIKDGLTGLAVHRYFRERLSHETKRSARTNAPFSLLIADIDHFKEYNDTYGHISGDVVLKHLAESLKSMVTEGDMVARYGGEEFAIILLDKDKQSAVKEAESIRKRIEQESVVLRRQKIHLTISIGVSSYPADSLLDEELIQKADTRLYKAKREGRNKVCG